MKKYHLLGAYFVLTMAAFPSAYSTTITPSQLVEVTLQLKAPLPTADIVSIEIKDIGNSTDTLTATVYDGDTFLGALTVDSVPGPFSNVRQFEFLSSTSLLVVPLRPAPIIDSSSINSGAINFRLVLSVQSGAFAIDTQAGAGTGDRSWVSLGDSTGPGEHLNLDTYAFRHIGNRDSSCCAIAAAIWFFSNGKVRPVYAI